MGKRKMVFELIDEQLAEKCETALKSFREGDDEASVTFGEMTFKLWDRKDNDNRETVRMSMDEFMSAIRMCHMNGAAMASTMLANVVAGLSGFKLNDDKDVPPPNEDD